MPGWTAAAIIGSGIMQSNAASGAAETQGRASEAATAEQRRQYDLSRQDQYPWLRSGRTALEELNMAYGLPTQVEDTAAYQAALDKYNQEQASLSSLITAPVQARIADGRSQAEIENELDIGGSATRALRRRREASMTPTPEQQQAIIASNRLASLVAPKQSDYMRTQDNSGYDVMGKIRSTPGYQFRLGEGMKWLEGSAAARGGLFSGATLKGINKYGQDFATNEFQNYTNRLSNLAGVGQTSATNLGNLGSTYATNIGNIGIGNANASAANQIAQGNIIGSTMMGLGGLYANRNRGGGIGYGTYGGTYDPNSLQTYDPTRG